MKNVTVNTSYGNYCVIYICKEGCGNYARSVVFGDNFKDIVCRKCGSELERKVGKFEIEEVTTTYKLGPFVLFKKTEQNKVGFKVREL